MVVVIYGAACRHDGVFAIGYIYWMRFVLVLLFLSCAGSARAQLSEEDLKRQLAYTGLLLADWAQTRYIATHPADYHETNPLLGKHPSLARTNNYFAASLAVNWGAVYAMPADWRPAWQYSFIAMEAFFVLRNRSLGIGFEF